MHLRLYANHVQLISACYPPSSALLTAGPDYRPNSQELSRLTYYASNRPGKITKLSNELHKRILADSRKAHAGNLKARASLLISLAIFKALISECRRDISLLSASLMAALDKTLAALPTDLEVAARLASVFTAWTTYTDGQLIGADAAFTRDYVSVMKRFASMCRVEAKGEDCEERNRTRLIGLGALTGAVTSGALYNSSTEFKSQVSVIAPALLLTIHQAGLTILNEEAEIVKMNPSPYSPYLSEFRTQPTAERRAASIHVHIDGVNGPSISDVANATIRALSCLLSQSNGPQVGYVLQEVLNSLEQMRGWEKVDHCCWFAQVAVQWTQYQYRYAVPTRLVERLSEAHDNESPTNLHRALVAMIKTVFTSSTPLVNLSTSDILSTLVTILFRRIAMNPQDILLLDLVECIAALGTHIYYTGQIQDLACELISRLVTVESNGIPGRPGELKDKDRGRPEAVRCIVAGLIGLMRAADKPLSMSKAHADVHEVGIPDTKFGSTPAALHEAASTRTGKTSSATHDAVPRRTKITPEAWQDTLTLLCDAEFAIRADYTRALLVFLKTEIPQESTVMDGDSTAEDGVEFGRPLAVGPMARAQIISAILNGDDATSRFLNALHAAVYVLATSFALGDLNFPNPSPSESISGLAQLNVNVIPSTPPVMSDNPSITTEDPSDTSQKSSTSRRRSLTITPHARKLCVVERLLEQASVPASQAPAAASASDYAHITQILTMVHEQLPCRALLTGVPMLVTMQKSAITGSCEDGFDSPLRRRVIGEVVASLWLVIGRIWDCRELINLAEKALFVESCLPPASLELTTGEILPPAVNPTPLSPLDGDNFQSVDPEAAIAALASQQTVQHATGLDEQTLLKRLGSTWTPETALKHSVERSSGHDFPRGDGSNPVLKISPALMHIENLSLQSLTRSTRGVGVSDLRDALEGRGGMSSTGLVSKPGSASSLDHVAYSGSSESRALEPGRLPRARMKRPFNGDSPTEVRDVLNKLGIGSQNANSLLKASFPALQKSNTRPSMLVPPYKT